ncbi:hypothetical protein Acr_07g0008860 [Actinidia rufa]|uniref:HXXXD-type acyl-transferase family protein n=1 Tax=Actinidia rufa TaxID=165716 RepID=A0A7J0EXM3_9ERIC|nr:hypothetical protein Acr_07g0008860 [Actinidia rufa]
MVEPTQTDPITSGRVGSQVERVFCAPLLKADGAVSSASRPIGPGKTHRLSGLDQGMGLHTLHTIFYYRVNPFPNLDLTTLLVSLSELLTPQLVSGGHGSVGTSGGWGVGGQVQRTVDEWLRSARGSEERDLTAWEDMPDDPSIYGPHFAFRLKEADESAYPFRVFWQCIAFLTNCLSDSEALAVAGLKDEELWLTIDCTQWTFQEGKMGIIVLGRQLMYEDMFKKDERPVHVSCHVGNLEGEGLITVMPSPEGGLGQTMMVMLPEEEIDKLCEDGAISWTWSQS